MIDAKDNQTGYTINVIQNSGGEIIIVEAKRECYSCQLLFYQLFLAIPILIIKNK